jgi:hypothetical protein
MTPTIKKMNLYDKTNAELVSLRDILKKPLKLPKGQALLLAALRHETSGRLTKDMGCFLLQTTPQGLARMAIALSSKNLVHRECNGTIRLNK